MKAVDIVTMHLEGIAADRTEWRSAIKQHPRTGEDKYAAADKRARRQEGRSSIRPETTHSVHSMSAIKIAIPTLVFSAISEALQPSKKLMKLKNPIRMHHTRSSLTDAGLYGDIIAPFVPDSPCFHASSDSILQSQHGYSSRALPLLLHFGNCSDVFCHSAIQTTFSSAQS